jgi:hypothetical protein
MSSVPSKWFFRLLMPRIGPAALWLYGDPRSGVGPLDGSARPSARLGTMSGRWAFRLAALLCFAWVGVQAQGAGSSVGAYECTRDGVTTYSDTPCGSDERHISVEIGEPGDTKPDRSDARLRQEEEQSDAYLQQLELRRAIARSEGRISDLQKQRDADLEALRVRLNQGVTASGEEPQPATQTGSSQDAVVAELNNDHLIEQMQLINSRYAEDIAVEERKLQGLQRQAAALDDRPSQPPD